MNGRVVTLVVVAALLLGCSSDPDDGSPGDDRAPTTTTEATPDAGAVVAEIDVSLGPAMFAVTVHPLVRTADVLVLTLDVEIDDPDGSLGRAPISRLEDVWSSSSFLDLPSLVGLRLLDTAGGQVVSPAVDDTGDTVAVVAPTDEDGAALRVQVAYGDPGADTLALFVPQGGVVEDVPVIEADVPTLEAIDDDEEPLDPGLVVSAPVEPVVAYSLDLDGSARAEAEAEQVTIALGADVLFAADSADLTAEAEAVIDEAVVALRAREPGPVTVLGHTDSTASDEYNLDLSRRRADEVAAALAQRIDTTVYPVQAEGRGESEPVEDNGSEEGRSANRRVELTIATALTDDVEAPASAAPAPFDGPTATGADGLAVDQSRTYRVAAPRARLVDGHLVVELTTTATDDAVESVFGPAIHEGRFPSPPGLDRLRTMAGIGVVDGSTVHFPVLHVAAAAEPDGLVPMTDLATFARLDGGDTRTSALVYPRGVPVGETVTLQLVDIYDVSKSWRLTDIPVER